MQQKNYYLNIQLISKNTATNVQYEIEINIFFSVEFEQVEKFKMKMYHWSALKVLGSKLYISEPV